MIFSRRFATETGYLSEVHMPSSSGPRCARVRIIRAATSRESLPQKPATPHISGLPQSHQGAQTPQLATAIWCDSISATAKALSLSASVVSGGQSLGAYLRRTPLRLFNYVRQSRSVIPFTNAASQD